MHGVSRHFNTVIAVDGVTFDVPPTIILGIIGPSGSGKTTLVRILTGTLKATAGSVQVLGEDPQRFRRKTREQLGYMPQLFVMYPDLTAAENVSFVGSLFGLLWRRRRRRVRQVLELVQLWDVRNRRAGQLSGGMQRRLELACALVHEPTLIFMDEPTAGQDPILRQTIWSAFRRLRDQGRTLVITTQYVGEADYCDRVAVLAEGRLIALGEPEELRRDALGGDVIEIETTRTIDAASLAGLADIKEVRQPGPRRILVIVEDAGSATPRLLEALRNQGVEVASSSEYRPSFDEVFGELVARKQHERAQSEAADAHPLLQAGKARVIAELARLHLAGPPASRDALNGPPDAGIKPVRHALDHHVHLEAEVTAAADQVAERARSELVLGRRHGLVDDERRGQSAQPDRPSDAPSRQRKMSSGASLMRRRLPGVARAYGGVVGSRTYFPLWVGQLGSSFGDMPHHIAVIVPVFQLT